MAMSDAKFIELCIPDSLRLAEHQDAALVNEAIATTLMAYRKALRDNVWEKNIAADINRAMTAYMEGTYVPHISKENEDWSKLQLEAEEARVMKAAKAEVKASEPTPFDITMTAFSNVTDRASLTAAHEQYLNNRSSFTPSQKVDANDAWRDARDMIEAREEEAERLKDIELGGEAMRQEWERSDAERYAARLSDIEAMDKKAENEASSSVVAPSAGVTREQLAKEVDEAVKEHFTQKNLMLYGRTKPIRKKAFDAEAVAAKRMAIAKAALKRYDQENK